MRPTSLLSLLLLTLGLLPQPVQAQAVATAPSHPRGSLPPPPSQPAVIAPATTALPRVRLVATGGTISNRNGGRLTAEGLVAAMPGIERYVRPEAEQFANTSSSELTLKQWLELARRINALVGDDPDLAGIVVTSGT